MADERIGIIGASGFTGAELLRLCAGHPELEVVLATGDTQAGTAVAEPLPEPGRRPTPTWSSRRTTRPTCDGLDLVFLALPHGASQAVVPELPSEVGARRRPRRRLPAGGRRALPAVVRRGAPRAPSCSPRPSTACPSCSATRSRGARLVAAPGCYVDRRRRWPCAPLVRAGADRARRRHRRRRLRRVGRRPRAEADHRVLHRRRGLHRLRPARPPPHARDRAGHRRAGAVHAAPGADEPGHPRHLLRPAGGRRRPPTHVLGALARRLRRRAVRRRAAERSPSTKATLGSNTRPPHRPVRRAHRLGRRASRAIDNLVKGASGQALQCANLVLGLPETAGPRRSSGSTRERHRAGRASSPPASAAGIKASRATPTCRSSPPPTARPVAAAATFTANKLTAAPVVGQPPPPRRHRRSGRGRHPQQRQRQRRHRRRRAWTHAERMCARRGRGARLPARRGARVLDRPDRHPAARSTSSTAGIPALVAAALARRRPRRRPRPS